MSNQKQLHRRIFGQHFLKDPAVCELIAKTALTEASQRKTTRLLEIGPGKGAITHVLLKRLPTYPMVKNLLLVERDRHLVADWKMQLLQLQVAAQLQSHSSSLDLAIEEHDFVTLDEVKWLGTEPLAVVSNLPYSAGTAILTRLAKHPRQISVMVLMFQSEVAKRLRAEPSTPDRGSLSLWIQNHWEVRKLCTVPPQAFNPPPKVQSEVVVLTPRQTPRIPLTVGREAAWEACLKTAFAHRRKMLRSIIEWRNVLAVAGVDGTKRAEALDWDEWSRLFQALQNPTSEQSS